ncbi:TIR domain-containing protein [Duganella sp. Dugasp56]|uniref:TIR domain-containing protein n=1 Tax=Duganella sp. Dugasp56 TaxID=3243046 RepID=UPI0039AEAA75
MTKPRVFIGSSVEGLNIAYPVQQNLCHVAEVTVWPQGIFELSGTTIESLTKALDETDFAIFVFSGDDLATIRKETANVVRDNVLFEFGLFIGKLGRQRVFFLIPSDAELHLPTDLLGITPGKYESARQDKNMIAATGAVCHQIHQQMKVVGILPNRTTTDIGKDKVEEEKPLDWISEIENKKYASAKVILENNLKSMSGDDALEATALILYCEIKDKKSSDFSGLIEYATKNQNCSRVQSAIGMVLRLEGYMGDAIKVLSFAIEKFPENFDVLSQLFYTLRENADDEVAVQRLQSFGLEKSPEATLLLAEHLERIEKTEEAMSVVQRCFANNPKHIGLQFKYARLAQEMDKLPIAAYLFNALTREEPTNDGYWGYLGNLCVSMNLYDMALGAYREAEKLSPNSGWITANIGNVFLNNGLPKEACHYFERAILVDKHDEYSLEKLSGVIKKMSENQKAFDKQCAEGKRLLYEAMKDIISENAPALASPAPTPLSK